MATKDFSSKQEKMIADFLGWSVVAGSGAAACFPGDIISDEWLGECKTHVERGHKIFFDIKVWKKIKEEAMTKRRFPVLFTDDGSQKEPRTWCLFDLKFIDPDKVILHVANELCNKNISFSHEETVDRYNRYRKECQSLDKLPVFAITWEKDIVGVCTLDAFRELLRE